MFKMHRRCFLCNFCALLMIHIEAEPKCRTENGPDARMSAGSGQVNAFYALRSCHQILHGDRGEFFSPDYLCSNPALWCNWTIQVQPGKRVQVYLWDLTPEHRCLLKSDQIHFDESPVTAGKSILEHCWRSSMYTSLSNTVHVVQLIPANPNPPHRGFYGVYRVMGLPETPDLNEDVSEEVETEAKDAVTKIPSLNSFSNELEENIDDAHVEDMGVSHGIGPQPNEVLAVTGRPFGEIRKIRGGAKDQDDLDEVDELVSGPTGIPETYTPHGPHTLAPIYTTHSISTSTGTTLTQSTKKKAAKRKPVLAQSSTRAATVNKNEVATQTPDDPADAKKAAPSAPSVQDVGAVTVKTLKTDGPATLRAASEERVEHVLVGPNSKKEKSLPVQTFSLAPEPPHFPGDCSRTSVPTVLYATCFLLCVLIALLMVSMGVMYRRYHHRTFLPRCRRSSSSFTDSDINNNPNSGSGNDGNTSRAPLPPLPHPPPPPPPPPPPLRLAGAPPDLPLLRFSPLTPPGGYESRPENNTTLKMC